MISKGTIGVIGARTPGPEVECGIHNLVGILQSQGYTISTGLADGVDQAAAFAAYPGPLELFLPWDGYEAEALRELLQVNPNITVTIYDPKIHQAWTDSVLRYHPAGNRLRRGAFALHARNFPIVENRRLVVAFPSDKPGGGGTGQGIRICTALKIPLITRVVGAPGWDFEELTKAVLLELEGAA
jgi:hypothetical protein